MSTGPVTRGSAERTRAAIVGLLLALGVSASAHGQVRNVRVGDRVDPFTRVEIDGRSFRYEHSGERVTLLTFAAAYQKRSDRALDELAELTARLRRDGHPVDLLAVVSGGEGVEHFRGRREELAVEATMLVDADDALWGRLGVVVTPTTFLLDRDGTIRWIRAGHSYDFATEARTGLSRVLGLVPPDPSAGPEPEEAAPEASADVRAARHVRRGRILARKGDVRAGLAELRRADALTPGDTAVRLELGRLLCLAGEAEEALAVAEGIEPASPAERARVGTVAGWAHRLLDDLDRAEALLTEAVELDPRSGRALYELGRVLEQRGDCERAVELYRRALAVHHGPGRGGA